MERKAEANEIYGRLRRGVQPVALLLVLLATVEPFIGFLDRNRAEYLQLNILIQLALGSLAVSMVAYVLLLLVFRHADPRRIAAAQAAFVFCFFRYGDVFRDADQAMGVRLGGWVVLTGVVVAAVALWSRRDGVRLFMVLFLVMTAALPAVSYASYELGGDETASESRPPRPPIAVADASVRTPDVWWLLVDGYARNDVLEATLGFDNSLFTTALSERGFTLSDDGYASFPATAMSISSVLDLDYVATTNADLSDGGIEASTAIRKGGRVVDALRGHGYRYLYADDGVYDFSECDPSTADVCLDAPTGRLDMGNLARTVADLTPLAELRSDSRPDPVAAVERAQRAMSVDDPEFVFAHILSPHHPLWFDEDCSYLSTPIRTDFRADRYLHQIECLNPRLLQAVDAIILADPEAIVMVQSDHGSGFLADWEDESKTFDDWSSDAISERYSILEALRFPDGCSTPQGDHSNVSTFEYVLACIEGRKPMPIADRYFFWRNGADGLIEIQKPAAIGEG